MERDIVLIGVLFLIVGVILFVMGQLLGNSWQYMMNDMMNPQYRDSSSAMSFLGIILVIIGLITMITGAVYPEKKGQTDMKKNEEASEIVKTRYAKGEITKEQFDQMKKDLE